MNSNDAKQTPTLTDKTLAELSSKAMNEDEQARRLQTLPNWQVTRQGRDCHLRCDFSFARYADALGFTAAIGELADACSHYPTIITAYLRVTVIWQSPDNANVSEREFALAAKTSDLAVRQQQQQ